jgi:hypothetical protein
MLRISTELQMFVGDVPTADYKKAFAESIPQGPSDFWQAPSHINFQTIVDAWTGTVVRTIEEEITMLNAGEGENYFPWHFFASEVFVDAASEMLERAAKVDLDLDDIARAMARITYSWFDSEEQLQDLFDGIRWRWNYRREEERKAASNEPAVA